MWFCPLERWLAALAQGWRLPSPVVEPMRGYHGQFAVLLTREIESSPEEAA